ncbi:hypothetical protein BD408DRAFT_409964 [Parasitella parasitica]|nr:hypothetical protein BD408DRAFT_409964 [Parasitella parasitica]
MMGNFQQLEILKTAFQIAHATYSPRQFEKHSYLTDGNCVCVNLQMMKNCGKRSVIRLTLPSIL